jgi:addiction module HigA family antidote
MTPPPHNPPHPGKILKELYLDHNSLTVTEAAELLDITRPCMSAIVNGRTGISARMAIKLSKLMRTTPQFWMILQMDYDLYQESLKQ